MAVYKCSVCGYIFDEEKEGKAFTELTECPVCKQPVTAFEKQEVSSGDAAEKQTAAGETAIEEMDVAEQNTEEATENAMKELDLKYPSQYARTDTNCRYMTEIHEMAVTGKSISAAMGTQMSMPNWDDILVLGAQLNPMPLDEHAPVVTTTVIGKHAKKPMILDNPVYISHMSFGALSKEIKLALSKGSAMARTAMCSGEGGILPEVMEAAYKYIFEYVPNLYSVTDKNLRNADAIEIKIGQGTKPGMGGHLPGHKVTAEIAAARNKPMGEDVISPSRFPGINTKEDLKELVKTLRTRSDGRPIGIKIAAACQQYRICGTGMCPVGVATQDEELRARLKTDAAAQRVANYLNVTLNELKTFARITGHENLHDLNVTDLCTTSREIAEYTNIPHA